MIKTLKNIEDHFENQEKERLEKLRTNRVELLKPYTEIEPLALGHMQQDVFDNYLTGVKIAHEQRIAAEKKAEEDRLAAIEAERVRQENIRLENERLEKEIADKETVRLKLIADEKKAKEKAEKAAKLAPDKDKLLIFMQAINDLQRPEVKSIEAASIATNANALLIKVANYIKENADKL